MYARDDCRNQKADNNSPHGAYEKLNGCLRRREEASDSSDDCQPIYHQGGRVVDEAFALEDTYERPRNVQRPHDRKHGYRIRGRDDRTERDRGRPSERWMEPVRDGRDGCRRDEHQDDRETEDRADLAPEIAKRVVHCPRVKERWDENEEEHLWRQRDPRQSRDESENEAANDEDRCVGNPYSLGDEAQPGRDSEEKQNELETGHGTIISETSEVSTLSREVADGRHRTIPSSRKDRRASISDWARRLAPRATACRRAARLSHRSQRDRSRHHVHGQLVGLQRGGKRDPNGEGASRRIPGTRRS